ncbi:N-terminal asparagine amidohydrolase-like protein [Lentithecium fluviatile CBS 122367]|uniref:N-terminal asparagine amidohydrolase-like protein n=1 Tax=Lentithecium fluviatile CBS 122367 TaxID=1168545 RepID=A0A6G1IF86_9PLEO|nr:N-terminal asparagine amidohydrolase-like protein [Lentithecium fluviatile CBS 122367]
MKVALLQFAPEVGKVQENIQRADEILQDTRIPVDLDWLILPEMAFSGYNFHSLEEIQPYLEPTTAGITTRWAIQVAQHYNCTVTVGYPEITTTEPRTQYNSTVTISPTGQILKNYRKAFLYYTDETWASEGPVRFSTSPLGTIGPVTLGICMDINPYKFLAPWEAYEFANTALTSQTPLICVSMAWLCHLSPTELLVEPGQPDVATVAYWVERFQPIVEVSREKDGATYVLLANRCGVEKGVCYAGSSTVIKIEGGGVSLFETAGKSEERCLVVDLSERPKFQVRSGR